VIATKPKDDGASEDGPSEPTGEGASEPSEPAGDR
jgi:hypothetical protein